MAIKLLSAVAATGASNSVRLDRKDRSLQLSGTFVGTVQLQESQDDSTWITIATLTATGISTWISSVEYTRLNVSAYTSGNITGKAGSQW